MNIPIPQDIPGLITFWLFLHWVPLLWSVTGSVIKKVYEELGKYEPDEDISEKANYYITVAVGGGVILFFWLIITASLLGLRLLIQMIWC